MFCSLAGAALEACKATPIARRVLRTGGLCWQVSEGYRRPIPEDWPEDIRRLVADCWAAQAMERPPMRQVATRLADFLASAELEVRPGLAGWPGVQGSGF